MERKYHPTARSPGLLVAILYRYPVLESLLSVSHRSDIIHLAQTSKALHKELAYQVSQGLTEFRSCGEVIGVCGVCNAVMCRDCVGTTYERDERGPTWGDLEYILVGGGRTDALR